MNVSVSKQNIFNAALKLFSTNGYEATGIEQITNEVGIKKASFYSHFKSKQELLDTLIIEITERYQVYAELVQKNLENAELNCNGTAMQTAEIVFNSIKCQFEFLIYDSFFSMARNFLTIEQFRNPELASLQNKCEYIDALNYNKKLIQYLVENGVLIDKGIDIMAYEFFSPIYVQFYHIQKMPELKAEAMMILKEHINHFFTIFSK